MGKRLHRAVCPNRDCGAAYDLDDSYVGQKIQCPSCGALFYLERTPQALAVKPHAQCPHCQTEYSVDPAILGTLGQCANPDCGRSFTYQLAGLTRPSDRLATTEQAGEWQVGDLFLDVYEVKAIGGQDGLHYAEGGMGRVYRVHHRKLGLDMAVKCPRPDLFSQTATVEDFERECGAWVRLGCHPHIVSCHYVRRIDGKPYVFAEFVEGGSLADWIRSERLYEGGSGAALDRILDVAIQFAWALQYAHDQGLIHQDVKPANAMMTPDGTLRLTDFGLARALAREDVEHRSKAPCGPAVSYGGMTPAYCSPEQAAKQPLTPKTDLWSWAVSALEMFIGELRWRSGPAAPHVLADWIQSGEEPGLAGAMPAELADLLQACFRENPADRPESLRTVAEQLMALYRELLGRDYRRAEPRSADLLADGLNNRGVSLFDLGEGTEACRLWEEALRLDPHHPEATFNRGWVLWHSGRHSDEDWLRQMQEMRTSHPDDWLDEYLTGLAHLARGDRRAALCALEEAGERSHRDRAVLRHLEQAQAQAAGWGRCLFSRPGHDKDVTCLALSPDGRRALTGSQDATLRLWETTTGACVHVLRGHKGAVRAVVFTPDGSQAVSGGAEGSLCVWDLNRGCCQTTLPGHKAGVDHVSVSPDGQLVLSTGADKQGRLWDLVSGQCQHAFEQPFGAVKAVSRDGNWALSIPQDGSLVLWELGSGKGVRRFRGHRNRVWSAAFSTDGRFLLSGGGDGVLRLWELSSGECVRELKGHAKEVTAVAVLHENRWAVSTAYDLSLRLWDLSTGCCLRTFTADESFFTALAVSPQAHQAVTGDRSGAIQVWVLERGPEVGLVTSRPRAVGELSHEQRLFFTRCRAAERALEQGDIEDSLRSLAEAAGTPGYSRSPVALDLRHRVGLRAVRKGLVSGWHSRTLDGHTGPVHAVAIAREGRYALSGSSDRTVRFWDLANGECLRVLKGHQNWVLGVALSRDERWGLSASADKTLRLWELGTGRCARVLEGHSATVGFLAFTPDGAWAISGGWDKSVRCWEWATGRCVRACDLPCSVFAVVPTPDGRHVVAACSDNVLRLLDLVSGVVVRSYQGHTGQTGSVQVTLDGDSILSGAWDDTLRVWNVATGRCAQVLRGFLEPPKSIFGTVDEYGVYLWNPTRQVALSADGHWAVAGRNHLVQLWELPSGRCHRTFEGHAAAVNAVDLSLDGRWLVSGGDDKSLRVWELNWDYEFPGWRDWDDGARPHLSNFLTRHTPCCGCLPPAGVPNEEQVRQALTRRGRPAWMEADFEGLLRTLAWAGYGWLRPDGVRHELERMAADWNGPTPLTGTISATDHHTRSTNLPEPATASRRGPEKR